MTMRRTPSVMNSNMYLFAAMSSALTSDSIEIEVEEPFKGVASATSTLERLLEAIVLLNLKEIKVFAIVCCQGGTLLL